MNSERKNKILDKFKWFTDMFLLSLIFILTTLPVITLGVSVAALYRSITKTQFHDEGYLFRTYWASWKENLKMGILLTVILLLYLVIVAYGIYYLAAMTAEGKVPAILYGISWLFLIPPAVIFPWACQYIATFNDRPGNVIRNSFTIGMANIGLTVLQIIIWAILGLCAFYLLPVIPFILAPLAYWAYRKTEPILLRIAQQTEGYNEDAWYNRH